MANTRSKKAGGAGVGGSARDTTAPTTCPDVLAGLPIPPETRGGYVPLLYPKTAGTCRAVLLSNYAFGWCQHWVNDRASAHHPDPRRCEGCQAGQLPRWASYIPCLTLPDRRQRLLQVSLEAWIANVQLQQRQGSLRGLTVTLRRTGTSRQGRVVAVVELTPAADDLPPSFDPRPVLDRLWGKAPGWLESLGAALDDYEPATDPSPRQKKSKKPSTRKKATNESQL